MNREELTYPKQEVFRMHEKPLEEFQELIMHQGDLRKLRLRRQNCAEEDKVERKREDHQKREFSNKPDMLQPTTPRSS